MSGASPGAALPPARRGDLTGGGGACAGGGGSSIGGQRISSIMSGRRARRNGGSRSCAERGIARRTRTSARPSSPEGSGASPPWMQRER
jgi:hypothetical protein